MRLKLRPLEETDFALLHDLLNEPHLRPFYMREVVSLEYVSQKYRPRVGKDHNTKCVIATQNDQPFGYMQWYVNRSYPKYGAAIIGRTDGVSIDYFIGDKFFLGRRLGSEMLRAWCIKRCQNLISKTEFFT